ncbi:MAG: hypothetical protein K8T10_07920 [Candidatus Eremiobacteraeota bacterium]|nr:hypothetical protein [Candidatus Eremiobacteraeota bacterium]
MKRLFVLALLVSLLFCIVVSATYAATPDVRPFKVIIGVGKNDNYATFDGLKVRVNSKKDEFFSHNCFITHDDLKKLAQKRKVVFKIDKKANKMMLGKRKLELVKVNPKAKKSHSYNSVRYITYKGKTYYGIWGIYPGLGFVSVSKTSKGVVYGLPSKK